MTNRKERGAPGRFDGNPGAQERTRERPEAYRGIGFQCDIPLEQWPAVEKSAAIVLVGDRERAGARKMIRRFIGRPRLRQLMKALPGRWLFITLGHAGMTAGSTSSVAGLIELHEGIFALSRLVRGHIEVFHGLDAETRALVVEAGKKHDLQMAPARGRA